MVLAGASSMASSWSGRLSSLSAASSPRVTVVSPTAEGSSTTGWSPEVLSIGVSSGMSDS